MQFFINRLRGRRVEHAVDARSQRRERVRRRRVEQFHRDGAVARPLRHVHVTRRDHVRLARPRAFQTALRGDDGRLRGRRGGRRLAAPTAAQPRLGRQLDGVLVYVERVVARRGGGERGGGGGERKARAHARRLGRASRRARSARRAHGRAHDRLRAHRLRRRRRRVAAGDGHAAPRARLRFPHRHRQPQAPAHGNPAPAALQLMSRPSALGASP